MISPLCNCACIAADFYKSFFSYFTQFVMTDIDILKTLSLPNFVVWIKNVVLFVDLRL